MNDMNSYDKRKGTPRFGKFFDMVAEEAIKSLCNNTYIREDAPENDPFVKRELEKAVHKAFHDVLDHLAPDQVLDDSQLHVLKTDSRETTRVLVQGIIKDHDIYNKAKEASKYSLFDETMEYKTNRMADWAEKAKDKSEKTLDKDIRSVR